MPVYQVHRLKEGLRQQFRSLPHISGVTIVKPKDYEPGTAGEAATPYALWLALRGSSEALELGDVLALDSGELCILKYIGFEEARWHVVEPAPHADAPPVEVT